MRVEDDELCYYGSNGERICILTQVCRWEHPLNYHARALDYTRIRVFLKDDAGVREYIRQTGNEIGRWSNLKHFNECHNNWRSWRS